VETLSALPDNEMSPSTGTPWGETSRLPDDNDFPPGFRKREISRYSETRSSPFGRRHGDLHSENLITKRLVVISVFAINMLYLAGDVLITGNNFLCQ
jgi:hypothetical protein